MMSKADWVGTGILQLTVLFIFYPLFYSTYVYTDEVVQLWMYRSNPHFSMFISQGRYITEKLFQWLFGSIDTIEQITYIRLFSLAGWMVSIPVWYYHIKKVVVKEGLPVFLTFFSVLYLICTPSFSTYVQWASCLELFLANTCGLIAGYILYTGICNENGAVQIPAKYIFMSVCFGLISLFTYQTGFGCFLLPFLLHLIAKPKSPRTVFIGIGLYLATYLIYYILFKLQIALSAEGASERTGLHIAPFTKLKYFLSRPLPGSFDFTYLFQEKSLVGYMVFAILFSTWFLLSFFRRKGETVKERLPYFLIVFFVFLLIYIPGLVVRENYASNRTLLALNMAVFFLVAEVFYYYVQQKHRKIVGVALGLLFVINAWYNFNKLFLQPALFEYARLRTYIEQHYTDEVKTFYFIRPDEEFFVRRFGITRSWDEFGVPSSFRDWVPELFVKQIIYEKTGDRQLAASLEVEHWPGKESFIKSGRQVTGHTLFMDAESIMQQP